MLNHYETVFILTPVLTVDQAKETVNRFKSLLTDNGAAIVNEEFWGMRPFAYSIDNKKQGFYVLLEFDAEPSVIDTLTTQYRRDEKVMRFLTTKLDKYAAEYAVKRRNLKSSKVNEAKEN